MAWLARVWVLSACFGWLPGTWLVMAQTWWWLLSSLVVCVVSLTQPVRHRLREPAWWMGVASVPILAWMLREPTTLLWAAMMVLSVLAGWLLVERGQLKALQQAVGLSALVAVVIWPWGMPLGHRAVFGTLLGMASLRSRGWPAWVWGLLSVGSGSWTGSVIPLVRLLPLRWRHPLTWVLLTSVVLLGRGLWWSRFALRWQVWSHLGWVKAHWLAGYGLGWLPGGFQEVTVQTGREIVNWSRDLHNTGLDVLARGGLLGLVGFLLVMGWAWRRSTTLVLRWQWLFACWVMSWQSVAAQPALLCLGLVWLLSLCEPTEVRDDAVDSPCAVV